MVNYRDIAMGKPSTEDLTNDFDADPFKQRVSLDQNTRQSKFNQEFDNTSMPGSWSHYQ